MLKPLQIIFTTIVLFGFILISCTKKNNGDNNDVCSTTAKSFSSNVNPIIQTYCNQPGCHNPGSTNGPGPLTNYTQVFNARNLIRGQIAAGLMPQNATLTATQKNTILCWIDSGAPND